MTPDSTSPVPAVASRASPAVDSRARPSGWATTVVGPLSSTIAPVAAARSRAAARRSSPGRVAGEAGELAVVGGEHGRAPPRGRPGPPPGRRGPHRPSPSTTSGHGRAADTRWWTAATAGAPRPGRGRRPGRRPGRAGRAPPSSHPAAGTAMPTASVGRPGSWLDARATPPAPSRRRPAGRPGLPGGRPRSCPASPAATTTAARHLWASAPAGAAPTPATSAGLDHARAGPRHVEADVGQHHLAGQRPARVEQQPGLERRERDRADGLGPRPTGAAPVSPSTPLGMSTASTGAPAGVGRPVLAPEAGAVGGVDHQVAGRERVGRLGARGSRPRTPRRRRQAGGLAAVVAVVALAGHDDDPPPVGAAEQVEGLAGDGRRRPGR